MKRLAVGPMTTLEYNEWSVRRINDNTPKSNQESSQSIKEYLRGVPSELEIIRQDFERRNTDLEKKIEQMEEEKINLRLDIDVQKLETEIKLGAEVISWGKLWPRFEKWLITYRLRRCIESDRGQELALLLRNIKVLSIRLIWKPTNLPNTATVLDQKQMKEQLEKIQQKMMDKMIESQGNMMTQLTQLLTGGIDKGKGSVLNVEEGDSEGPVYPPGFIPQHVEEYPRKSSVTIKPQQFQASAA
ncbi:hypothetical protein Gotur_033347, partial [Gossypium turneri]